MIGKRTTLILIFSIGMITFSTIYLSSLSETEDYSLNNSSINLTLQLKTPTSTDTETALKTTISTPVPPIKFVVTSLPAQPTMREIPEISINGPDNIKKGDKFTLEFQIDPKSEKIAGLGIDINFDGKLFKAENVDIFDPNIGQYPNLEKGSYIKGDITDEGIMNIAIAKEKGENIVGNFMNVEFKATRQGEAKITAQITAVNEESAYKEIGGVSKTIRIV